MTDPRAPDPADGSAPIPGRPLRRASRLPLLLAALLALALVGWLVYRYVSGRPAPPSVATPAAAPAGAVVPPATDDAASTPQPPPETVREALAAASADPLYRRCLAEDDPVRRFVVAVDNVALGVSPRRALGCLAPDRPFAVVRRGDRWLVSPQAYARYDGLTAAVRSADVARLAAAYRRFHAPLEAAYRLLGYPGGSLDGATSRALARVERFTHPGADLEVVEGEGAAWEYVDPALEQAGPFEKHLLRLGPGNARAVQEQARALRVALGLGAGAPAP